MPWYAKLLWAVPLAVPMAWSACAVQAADIIPTAHQAGQFTTFLRVLEAADMDHVLEGEGPLTVFAPTDDAFDELAPGVLDRLLAEENRNALEAVIQAHIVPEVAIMTDNLLGGAVEVPTLGGGTLAIDGTTGIIALAPIEPSVTDVGGQPLMSRRSLAMPVAMMAVEAPRPPVGATRRTGISEELIRVATVVAPDIVADNGVIHGIDLVLLPPEALWSF